jgi:RNA polymerase sigma-70 factor (ECF subfamily)
MFRDGIAAERECVRFPPDEIAIPDAVRPRELPERLPHHSAPASGGAVTPPREELTPERVFREYAPRIYNVARRMLGNDADADDATQDVLLQVVRKLDTFRGDSQLSTWLHRVTVNAALAHRQKRATRHRRETGAPADERLGGAAPEAALRRPAAPDESVLAAEQHEVIERAAQQLAEPFRVVYLFADVGGVPNAEIGARLGLTVSAVKSRLHRARLRMRHLLCPPGALCRGS